MVLHLWVLWPWVCYWDSLYFKFPPAKWKRSSECLTFLPVPVGSESATWQQQRLEGRVAKSFSSPDQLLLCSAQVEAPMSSQTPWTKSPSFCWPCHYPVLLIASPPPAQMGPSTRTTGASFLSLLQAALHCINKHFPKHLQWEWYSFWIALEDPETWIQGK